MLDRVKKRYKPGKPNKQLPHLDGRTKSSQRFKRLCMQLAGDLGREPSVAEHALIRQAAAAIVSSEAMQGKVIAGTATALEIAEAARLGNLAVRCINSLKLKGGKSGPSLDEYLRQKAEREAS